MANDWPSTFTAAVDRLMSTMTADDLTALRDTPKGSLIQYHFSLGMYIRNEFGLWQGNDELLRSCYPEVTDSYLLEIIKQDPDGASTRIIEGLWRRLQSSE